MRREGRKGFAGARNKSTCAAPRKSSAGVNSLAKAKPLKPRALQPGDKVGIIAPASSFNEEVFLAGCARMRSLGFEPVYSEGIFSRDLYFAGSAERRLREMDDLLERNDISAL